MPTFDFSTGVTADLDAFSGTPTNTASQTIGSDTLIVTVDAASGAAVAVMAEEDYVGYVNNFDGDVLLTPYATSGANSMTLTLDGGKAFDLTGLSILDQTGARTAFIFTTSKGNVSVVVDSSSGATALTFTDAVLQGVTSVTITQEDPGPNMFAALDDIVLDSIHVPPNTAPTFVGVGAGSVPQNGDNFDFSNRLHVSDVDSGQTLTWSTFADPAHGTLSISGVTAASGGADITPGGPLIYTPEAGFAGTDTFTVQVSDGSATATRQVTVIVTPLAPGAPDLSAVSDTGAGFNGSTDNITNAATLSFSGTSAAGDNASTVMVFLDKNNSGDYNAGTDPVASATVSNGHWTVSGLSTAGLSDGAYNVFAFVMSADGNTGSVNSTALEVQIDKTAPTQTVSGVSLSADTGDSAFDFITKTAAQTVSATLSSALGSGEFLYGSIDNGATWVDISSMVSGTAVAWTGVTLSGSDTLKLKVIDTAGNDGTVASHSYSLDTSAPSQPPTPTLDSASDTGASNSDNLTDDTTPTFIGTAEIGATVKLYEGGGTTFLGSGVVNGSGDWQVTTSALSAGLHTITAIVIDVAGNVSTASAGQTINIHTTNTAPTGGVSISGTATKGQTLMASNTLADADGLGTISYQWRSDGTDIVGATGSTLTLGSAQVGHAITVVASYTDGFSHAESVASSATSLVGALNSAPGGVVSITGTATQGQTLNASNTLTDADGLGAISYQWKSDGADIVGATTSSLTLTQAHVGHAITVVASYTDGYNYAESVTSLATGPVANINDAPGGTVEISGTATEGQTLNVTDTLTDADGLGVISYQWKSDGADIVGATGSSLTLTSAHAGHAITAVASYTDGFGHAESVTSLATGLVAYLNRAPVGAVSIGGTATQGQTLNANNTLTDADGLGAISYQWKSDGADIVGATGGSLTLTQAHVGHAITVVASYTDGASNAESVTSLATGPVANLNDAPVGAVSIGGTATQGQTLNASNTLTDADGLGAISYQWKSDGADIVGATTSSLTLTQAHVGHAITVVASYTDGFGHAEAVTSAATGLVANLNDAPGGTVSIGGTATQGQTLNASNTLTDLDGLGTIRYQWKSDGADIVGATTSSLALTQAHVGHAITVVASYTDGFGHAESVTSLATRAVANINDAPTGTPAISGVAEEGSTLTASTTGIADIDGLGTFSYVWKADGAVIGGATAASFTLTSDQIGHAVTVTVNYNDGFGFAESLVSAATATVQSLPEPPVTPPVVTLPVPSLPVVLTAAIDLIGLDFNSPKTISSIVILPNGTIVANPLFAALEQAKLISSLLTAGTITTLQASELLVGLAAPTQMVVHETYNFFTGAPPTAAGFSYLIDSTINTADLTDAYYIQFNTLNRYMNFAVNLGSVGAGKADFESNYGALTFEEAVSKAYDAVIGNQSARGFDPVASKAYVLSQMSYFQGVGGSDLGAKAAMVGFLLGVGATEHLGPYYQAAHDFLLPQVQLVGGSTSSMAEFA